MQTLLPLLGLLPLLAACQAPSTALVPTPVDRTDRIPAGAVKIRLATDEHPHAAGRTLANFQDGRWQNW